MAHHPGLTVTFGIPSGAVKVTAPTAKKNLEPLLSARAALRDALRLMLRNDLVLGVGMAEPPAPVGVVPPGPDQPRWTVYRVVVGAEENQVIATCTNGIAAQAIADALNRQPELIP